MALKLIHGLTISPCFINSSAISIEVVSAWRNQCPGKGNDSTVHSYHFSFAVYQRTSTVAGINSSICLYQSFHECCLGLDWPVHSAYDTCCYRGASHKAKRTAYSNCHLSDFRSLSFAISGTGRSLALILIIAKSFMVSRPLYSPWNILPSSKSHFYLLWTQYTAHLWV